MASLVVAVVAVTNHKYEMVLEDGTVMSVNRDYKPIAGSLPPAEAYISKSSNDEIQWFSKRQKILANEKLEREAVYLRNQKIAAHYKDLYERTACSNAKSKFEEHNKKATQKPKLAFGI
jgi:hypothetical protein